MSEVNKTPVLSKKRQNTSLSGRKKPLKTIKNVLSSSQANYWPIVNVEENNQLLDVINKINSSYEIVPLKKAKLSESDTEKLRKPKFIMRDVIKFGINEIYKIIKNDSCAAVLLDADLPFVLVAHILRLTIINSVPLLCIKDLENLTKSIYGFKSSSLCFMNETTKKFPKMIQTVKQIWNNYALDKETIDPTTICETLKSTVIDKTEDKNINPDDSLANDFIKFTKTETTISLNIKRKRKSKITFQPLLIKRIQNNPNRTNGK